MRRSIMALTVALTVALTLGGCQSRGPIPPPAPLPPLAGTGTVPLPPPPAPTPGAPPPLEAVTLPPDTPPQAKVVYSDKPDSTSVDPTMDTGQSFVFEPTSYDLEPVISKGMLTTENTLTGGLYGDLDAGPGNTLSRLGIKFRFDGAGATTNGAAVNISLTNGPKVTSGGNDYRIGVHLVQSQIGWGATKVTNATGKFEFIDLKQGLLDLKADTDYEMELWRDGDTVTIALPNGLGVKVTDPDIAAWSGQYGFFEVIMNAPTDPRPGITEVWYDTKPA